MKYNIHVTQAAERDMANTQTVHIVRFLYGKSNWITILKTDAANGSLPVFS